MVGSNPIRSVDKQIRKSALKNIKMRASRASSARRTLGLDDSQQSKSRQINLTVAKLPNNTFSENSDNQNNYLAQAPLKPLKLPSNFVNGISIHMVKPVTQSESIVKRRLNTSVVSTTGI